MKPLPLVTFVCPTCTAEWQALPGAVVCCTHGGRNSNQPHRLTAAALCTPAPTLTEIAS